MNNCSSFESIQTNENVQLSACQQTLFLEFIISIDVIYLLVKKIVCRDKKKLGLLVFKYNFTLRWYGKPSYCYVLSIEINNKSNMNFPGIVNFYHSAMVIILTTNMEVISSNTAGPFVYLTFLTILNTTFGQIL